MTKTVDGFIVSSSWPKPVPLFGSVNFSDKLYELPFMESRLWFGIHNNYVSSNRESYQNGTES